LKSSPDISWNEKGELKYKGETVQGSNVVDLVNGVLRKRKYFNPQGWETSQFWTSFLLVLGVFAECSLIEEGLCCPLRDLGVPFV
jgi:hypothetical protein